MRAYGNVITGTVGARAVDLPTTPATRPAHWPAKRERSEWVSPIARSTDPDATRRAEQAATQSAVVEAQAKDERDRARRRREPTPPRTSRAPRAPKPVNAEADARKAAARAERVAARLADLEAKAEQRAAEAEARLADRQQRREEGLRRLAESRAAHARQAEQVRRALADDLRRLYEAGDSLASIADTLGVSVTMVNRMRREFGIDRRRPALDRAQIVDLYAELRSIEAVAERLGTVTAAVRYHLAQAGVATRKPGDNGSRLPDDVRSRAIADYTAGKAPVSIMADLGIAETTLLRWVRQAGVPRNKSGRRLTTR